jgi:pyrroline-5-carboxylate reductase
VNGPLDIGIVGCGFLGMTLCRRLVRNARIRIADCDSRRTLAVAVETGATASSVDAVFRKSSIVLLVVPPDAVIPLVQEYSGRMRRGALLLNLASDAPSAEAVTAIRGPGVRLVGVKLVGQATAIACGRSAVFIVAEGDQDCVPALQCLFGTLGVFVCADESVVTKVNATATRAAIRLATALRADLRALDLPRDIVCAAVNNVAAGTLLDYPHRLDSPYMRARYAEVLGDTQLAAACLVADKEPAPDVANRV